MNVCVCENDEYMRIRDFDGNYTIEIYITSSSNLCVELTNCNGASIMVAGCGRSMTQYQNSIIEVVERIPQNHNKIFVRYNTKLLDVWHHHTINTVLDIMFLSKKDVIMTTTDESMAALARRVEEWISDEN